MVDSTPPTPPAPESNPQARTLQRLNEVSTTLAVGAIVALVPLYFAAVFLALSTLSSSRGPTAFDWPDLRLLPLIVVLTFVGGACYGLVAVLPIWSALWFGLSGLSGNSPSRNSITASFLALGQFIASITFLVGALWLGGVLIAAALACIATWLLLRNDWRLVVDDETSEPARLQTSLFQVLLATVGAACALGIVRAVLRAADAPLIFGAPLIFLSLEVVVSLATTWLFLGYRARRNAWLIGLAISIVPGGLLQVLFFDGLNVGWFAFTAGVPIGIVLCGFLDHARGRGLRLVQRAAMTSTNVGAGEST